MIFARSPFGTSTISGELPLLGVSEACRADSARPLTCRTGEFHDDQP